MNEGFRSREQGRGRSPFGGQSFEEQATRSREPGFGGRHRGGAQGGRGYQGGFASQDYGPMEREEFGYMGRGMQGAAPFSETQSRRSRRDFTYGDPMEGLGEANDMDFAPHGAQGHRGRGPKGYRRSDERILEDVNERLTQHDRIDASEIEVRVEQGEVTLSGTVDTRSAKHLAEDVAEGVSGVCDVQNNIRVRRESSMATPGQSPRSGQESQTSSATAQPFSETAKRESSRESASGASRKPSA